MDQIPRAPWKRWANVHTSFPQIPRNPAHHSSALALPWSPIPSETTRSLHSRGSLRVGIHASESPQRPLRGRRPAPSPSSPPPAGGPRRAAPRALGSKRNCRWARPLGPARLHRRPPNARLAHAGIVDGRPVTVGEPCAGQERPFGLKDLLGPYVNSCGDPFAGRPRVETKTRGGESPPPRARRGGPVRAPAHGVHHTLYSQQNIRCIQQNTRYILNRSQGLLGHPRP